MKKILSPKVILGFLVLVVVLLFGAVFVLFQNIENQNKNISNTQNSIDLVTKQNQYSVSLQESLQNSKPEMEKVNNSILSKDGDVGFIEKLETVAKSNGLDVVINSLSVEDIPGVNSNNLTSLKIRATVEGGWAGSVSFLTKLESLPFILRVEKFNLANFPTNSISLVPSKDPAQNWQSVFEIRVLKYKQ